MSSHSQESTKLKKELHVKKKLEESHNKTLVWSRKSFNVISREVSLSQPQYDPVKIDHFFDYQTAL